MILALLAFLGLFVQVVPPQDLTAKGATDDVKRGLNFRLKGLWLEIGPRKSPRLIVFLIILVDKGSKTSFMLSPLQPTVEIPQCWP